MITARLKLPLEDIEYKALMCAAKIELRSPIDQARLFIREGLARRGLLDQELRQPEPAASEVNYE